MLIQIYAEVNNNNNGQPKLLLLANGKPMPVPFHASPEEQNNKLARELRRLAYQTALVQLGYTDMQIKGRTPEQAKASDAQNRKEITIVEIDDTVIKQIIQDMQQSPHSAASHSTTFQYDSQRYTQPAASTTSTENTPRSGNNNQPCAHQ